MKCPNCGFQDSKVIDSRPIEEGNSIRRRRECLNCQKRFTTFEMIESMQILVVKKDGTKEFFDRSKMSAGIIKACQKRPVNGEEIAAQIPGSSLRMYEGLGHGLYEEAPDFLRQVMAFCR